MSSQPSPQTGDIWDAPLDPVKGHEQGGFRPVIVISADWYNETPHGLCMVVPLSRSHKGVRAHIAVPREGTGLHSPSYALCEQVRAISVTRLRRKKGSVSSKIVQLIRDQVREFLEDM